MKIKQPAVLALCRIFFITAFVVAGASWVGCGSDDTDAAPDVGVGGDVDVDTDPPVESGTCGGTDDLTFDGESAAPGDGCGDCGDGLLVCDGPDALECRGASEENACGGCGYLPGQPDASCGDCGDGVWTCQDDGSISCEEATEKNECGGCEELNDAPGEVCEAGEGTGVLRCTGVNEVRCIGAGENACGGSSDLGASPGAPCGECNMGVVICDGTDSVSCHDEETGLNACGGCAPLVGEPDEMCGQCGGEWFCATDDVAICDDSEQNPCGGCTDLGGDMPGDDCGGGSVWVCDGTDEMVCPDEPTNACGGDDDLEALPGEVCGECGDGLRICTSPNSVACLGAGDTNACDGCGLLPGEAGEECGTGATWECTDDGSMRCELDDGLNACGGVESLEGAPGQACGPCDLDVLVCDGEEALLCSGETPCPEFLGDVEAANITAVSATFEAEILAMPPSPVTEHGFCWSTDENPADDDTNCESLGEATEAGSFSLDVDNLQPETEYYLVAFATAGETVTTGEISFETAHQISGSSEQSDRVTITWGAVEDAQSYTIYRDGEEIATVGGASTSYDDFDADDPVLEAPEVDSVTDDLTEGVEVRWDEAASQPGTMHDYEVVANYDEGSQTGLGAPAVVGQTTGQKAAVDADRYEICIGGDCNDDDWMEVDDPADATGDLVHFDGSAPMATIDGGSAEASEGEFEGFVRLSVDGWGIEEADEQVYLVRAVSDVGAAKLIGKISDEIWGRRAHGELNYEWFASALDASGSFSSIYGPTTSTDDFDDMDAPEDSSDRHYYVHLSADGAIAIDVPGTDNPLVGFRASDADIETLSAQSIGAHSATLRGRLNHLGSPPAVEVGLCWNRSQPAEDGNCVAVEPLVDAGEVFETTTQSLGSGRQYYVRAYLENGDGETFYADHRSFNTRPGSPSVSATTNNVDEVTITWDSIRGASSYRIYRDGVEIATVEDPTTIYSDEAGAGGPDDASVPSAPEITSISQDLTEGIRIEWDEPGTEPGSMHEYEVRAINNTGPGAVGSANGRLAAPEIDGYELCIVGDTGCDENNDGDWDALDIDDELIHLDEAAPMATISSGNATASDAEFVDHVRLDAEGWDVSEPNEESYQLRAVNRHGASEASDEREGSRAVDQLRYQWFGSIDNGSGFEALFEDPADYKPDEDGRFDDEEADEDGDERDYYVQFSAAGAPSVDFPDVGGGEDPRSGRRAVQGEVDTVETGNQDIGTNTATLRGRVTTSSIPAAEEYGFCYSKNASQLAHDADTEACQDLQVVSSGNPPSNFHEQVSQLDSGTTYYVQAFIYTDAEGAGYDYGDQREVLTRPETPTGVVAESNDNDVEVSWGTPTYGGRTSITSYTVTANPAHGDQTCVTAGGYAETDCVIGGLHHGESYTFTVVATNETGDSPPSAPSNSVDIVHGNWKDISGGATHTCAAKGNGSLWCWGDGGRGRLGLGDEDDREEPEQVEGEDWESVSAGAFHTCATKDNGSLWCWGSNSSGQLGLGPFYYYDQDEPKQVEGEDWKSVSAGGSHTCATKDNGSLWCWGYDVVGGGGNTVYEPVQLDGEGWESVSTGGHHTCATKDNGSLWCWGSNHRGQLGLGEDHDETQGEPEQLEGEDWESVSAARFHTCATKIDDDSLWCWGHGRYGRLGQGDEENRYEPESVEEDKAWESVSADGFHTCATTTGGSLWCWGNGEYGQLGLGDEDNQDKPKEVDGEDWKLVSAGYSHTCATTNDDVLWCWGRGQHGQLGLGDKSGRDKPEPVGK